MKRITKFIWKFIIIIGHFNIPSQEIKITVFVSIQGFRKQLIKYVFI